MPFSVQVQNRKECKFSFRSVPVPLLRYMWLRVDARCAWQRDNAPVGLHVLVSCSPACLPNKHPDNYTPCIHYSHVKCMTLYCTTCTTRCTRGYIGRGPSGELAAQVSNGDIPAPRAAPCTGRLVVRKKGEKDQSQRRLTGKGR